MRICAVVVCVALASGAEAGILVKRSDKGYEFIDAVSVTVNGKDKAIVLGSQPKIVGPAKNLPSVKLTGMIIKDANSGVAAQSERGELAYLLPEGIAKDNPGDPARAWLGAKISFKRTASDKTPFDVPFAAFVAFLPRGVIGLVEMCTDDAALQLIGGKGKAFSTQVELLPATVRAFSASPGAEPLKRYVERSMRQRYDQFENGTTGLDVLNQALGYVELSKSAFPGDPEQEKLRTAIVNRKAWLDRKSAIQRAFAAAEQWDAFIAGDREFERFLSAFPDLAGKHTQALTASLQNHELTGKARMAEGEYGAALREFRLASARQPSNRALQKQLRDAWTEYSRLTAIDNQGKRRQLTAGDRENLNAALHFAARWKEQKKLDLALKSVLEAEAIDRESLPMLLRKAEILASMGDIGGALKALDEYDLHAIGDERNESSKLRNELMFQLTDSIQTLKTQLQKSWSEFSFNRAHALALQGVRLKEDDAELLFQAGLSSLVTRKQKESQAFFARYLEISNTLDANSEERLRVRNVLSSMRGSGVRQAEGEANWLSGDKLPAGVFYSPVSLAFQPRVDRIEASEKFKVAYEWEGNRLKAVTPTFEKNERVTGEKRITFAYDDSAAQVIAVAADGDAKAPSSSDPDERFKAAALVVLNSPYVDPIAVQNLTRANVTLCIAGNKWFHPFVWDRIHYFKLTYDSEGRVTHAREIADPRSAPGDEWLEFEWDGAQLRAVRGFKGPDGRNRVKTYERVLQYQAGQLLSEEIRIARGQTAQITYKYIGTKLASAVCTKDQTIDDRSRRVTFR
jgi:hypothetical protein